MNPTYHDLGDHSETIQVDYDPAQISYAQLLEVFWTHHNPFTPLWSRQYMSAILYHNEEQRRLALESKSQLEARRGARVHTQIVPAGQFYLAEDYHQKYLMKRGLKTCGVF